MARKDALTGKGPMVGNNRSHAMNASKRVWNLNLQKVTIYENGQKKTVKTSAKNARTLKKSAK